MEKWTLNFLLLTTLIFLEKWKQKRKTTTVFAFRVLLLFTFFFFFFKVFGLGESDYMSGARPLYFDLFCLCWTPTTGHRRKHQMVGGQYIDIKAPFSLIVVEVLTTPLSSELHRKIDHPLHLFLLFKPLKVIL